MSSQQSSPGMPALDLADMVVENPVSDSPVGVDQFPESPNNNIEIASPPWYENEENTPEQQNATYFTNSSPLLSRKLQRDFDDEEQETNNEEQETNNEEQEPKRQRIEGGRRKTNKRKSKKSKKSRKSKKPRKSKKSKKPRKPRSYKKRGGGSSISDDQDRNNLNFTSSNI